LKATTCCRRHHHRRSSSVDRLNNIIGNENKVLQQETLLVSMYVSVHTVLQKKVHPSNQSFFYGRSVTFDGFEWRKQSHPVLSQHTFSAEREVFLVALTLNLTKLLDPSSAKYVLKATHTPFRNKNNNVSTKHPSPLPIGCNCYQLNCASFDYQHSYFGARQPSDAQFTYYLIRHRVLNAHNIIDN
jgi:hypothetical protein